MVHMYMVRIEMSQWCVTHMHESYHACECVLAHIEMAHIEMAHIEMAHIEMAHIEISQGTHVPAQQLPHTDICLYIYACMCMCVCVHAYTCMFMHTNINLHT